MDSSFFVEIPSEDQASLKGKAALQESYRFFDFTYTLHTDAPEVLDFFRRLYGRFRVSLAGAEPPLAYYVLSEKSRPAGPCLLWADGRACFLPTGPALGPCAESVITSSALLRVRSHLILHAVAVSRNGHGLILAGLSGSGKTTLCMELLRRGFSFLSDELACLSRETHEIFPFPKALGVRDLATAGALGIDLSGRLPVRTAAGDEKWMVDVGSIPGIRLDTSSPLRLLILLETRSESEPGWEEGAHDVELYFRDDGHELMGELSGLEGVRCGPMRSANGMAVGRARIRKSRAARQAFLRFCRDRQEKILCRVKVAAGLPDGSGEPRLEGLSRWQAGLRCLEHLQNLQFDGGDVLTGSLGSPVRILAELSTIAAKADCYRLVVGNLKQTADLLCEKAG